MKNLEPFRRTIRLRHPADASTVDAQLVRHLEDLEKDSAHAMQEWIRSALREAFVRECVAVSVATAGGDANA